MHIPFALSFSLWKNLQNDAAVLWLPKNSFRVGRELKLECGKLPKTTTTRKLNVRAVEKWIRNTIETHHLHRFAMLSISIRATAIENLAKVRWNGTNTQWCRNASRLPYRHTACGYDECTLHIKWSYRSLVTNWNLFTLCSVSLSSLNMREFSTWKIGRVTAYRTLASWVEVKNVFACGAE